MLLEPLQAAAQTSFGLFSGPTITLAMGLLGGAVGYGMVKGKIDATETALGKMEERFEKRFDRLERTLDDIQRDMRNGDP